MPSISSYIFSGLIFFSVGLFAQKSAWNVPEAGTNGVRLGLDVSRILFNFLDKSKSYGEVSADIGLTKKIYVVTDLGRAFKIEDNTDKFSYEASGTYGRIGMDYNLFNSYHEIFFVGLRLGGTMYDQLMTPHAITGNISGDIYLQKFEKEKLTAQWTELVSGMKVEVFKNIFLGFTVRFGIKIHESSYTTVPSYIIPGYGKESGATNLSFSYLVYYRIPYDILRKKF